MTRRLADRRGRPRFEVVGDMWGRLETVVGMPVRNIGTGGALVQCSIPLEAESVHRVSVNCEGHDAPASVRVRHVRTMVGSDERHYYLIGLEFVALPDQLRAQIAEWTGRAVAPDERVEPA